MAIASWQLVRVYGTWTDADGALLAGTYTISITTRLTNSTDDLIIPAGLFKSGPLSTAPGSPSLDVLTPATDDVDIEQTGWKVKVEIRFADPKRLGETYLIDVPFANRPVGPGGNGLGVNLRTIALAAQITPVVATYAVGTPGGLAKLSADGQAVLDAEGDPITGGGGGAATLDDLTDVTLASVVDGQVLKRVAGVWVNAADAGGVPDNGSVTNAKVAVGAAIDLDKTADSATRFALTAARQTKLDDITTATTSAAGLVELATNAETVTGTDTVRASTPAGVKAAIDALVNAAPGTLDTLGELATALGSDPAFATTITTALANRVRHDTALQGLNSTQQQNARTNIGIVAATESAAGILEVATTGETTTGTLDNVIVTPLKLKAVADTKAALSHTHTAVDLPASVPHDVWQPSGGTWPSRPTVASGARVNAIGYPGLTDVPSWLVAGTDSYTMRTA